MASLEGPQKPIVSTPTPASSPSQSLNMTPHAPRRPSGHLIPPLPFNSASTTATNSCMVSSSTLTSAMPTPVDPISAIPLSTQPPSPSTEGWEDLSSSLIDSYDLNILRTKLHLANQLIKTLSSSLSAIRTNAAHYLLQHKILEMETTEAAARHQVESEITRREVEVLRLDQSAFSTSQQLALAEENEGYKRRLRRAKRSIREYREELGDMKEENERLKKRIRDNRQHQLDASRSPDEGRHGGRGDVGHIPSVIVERHVAGRPESGGVSTNEDDGLAALRFLASQVLSQGIDEQHESDSHHTTTPKIKHRRPTTTAPSTRRALLSPVAFTTSATSRGLKRRRSRDSTISASDDEGTASESGKRRRLGQGATILHSATRQRRCTHSPHPTPTAPLIHEHRGSKGHGPLGKGTPTQLGTPVSPPGRGMMGDVGPRNDLVGLGLTEMKGGIRSPP